MYDLYNKGWLGAGMRLRKHPLFRFTYRRNVIINDIESRNFLGIWQDNEIVISLSAILDECDYLNKNISDTKLVNTVSDVIFHEYLHHAIYLSSCTEGHHHIINKLIKQ